MAMRRALARRCGFDPHLNTLVILAHLFMWNETTPVWTFFWIPPHSYGFSQTYPNQVSMVRHEGKEYWSWIGSRNGRYEIFSTVRCQ